jgi:hypothetical protein
MVSVPVESLATIRAVDMSLLTKTEFVIEPPEFGPDSIPVLPQHAPAQTNFAWATGEHWLTAVSELFLMPMIDADLDWHTVKFV